MWMPFMIYNAFGLMRNCEIMKEDTLLAISREYKGSKLSQSRIWSPPQKTWVSVFWFRHSYFCTIATIHSFLQYDQYHSLLWCDLTMRYQDFFVLSVFWKLDQLSTKYKCNKLFEGKYRPSCLVGSLLWPYLRAESVPSFIQRLLSLTL